MAIEGPLKELNIHDVFQLLDLGRKTGVLCVTSELRQLRYELVAEPGPDDRQVDLAVLDRPPNGTRARRVVLLGITEGQSSQVTAVGAAPSYQTVRDALRSAAQPPGGHEEGPDAQVS